MERTVKSKYRKTLTRRLRYLEGLGDASNSYDAAEIAALRNVVDLFDLIDMYEDKFNWRLFHVLFSLETALEHDDPDADSAVRILDSLSGYDFGEEQDEEA